MTQDPHGQPYNVRFNRARRAEHDLSEFLGLAKGLLADGSITQDEAQLVSTWLNNHAAAVEQWPLNHLAQRIERMYSDTSFDEAERLQLADILSSIVGGTAGIISAKTPLLSCLWMCHRQPSSGRDRRLYLQGNSHSVLTPNVNARLRDSVQCAIRMSLDPLIS